MQQVTLWSHQHSGSPADTVCAAGLGYKDQAASSCLQLPVARPEKRCFLLVQTCCYCPNVLAFPRQWPLVFLIHVFLSSDSHSALSITQRTFIWCLLYARHITSTLVVITNKTKAQTLEPVSCLPIPAFSPLLCLPSFFPHQPFSHMSFCRSFLTFTIPHPCATMSVAFSCQQRGPPALWPDLWDFEQPAPALAASIRTLALCSHYLLTPVHPF